LLVDKSQVESGAAISAERYVSVSEGEARAAVDGAVCPACSGPKTPGFAFCRTDHLALTVRERAEISRGPGAAGFLEAYGAALSHLRAYPVRQKQLAPQGGWRFASPIELAEAGYVFLNDGHCGAPRCSREIWWFRTPDGGRVSVNAGHRENPKPFDWQPHRTNCADPGYWERVKQRQDAKHKARTEARRQRRSAKRVQTSARGAR
jgi:hypothetical protein